jgi:hypothetical protein
MKKPLILKDETEMFMAVERLMRKHGFKDVMIVYTEPVDNEQSMYKCMSNFMSESLADYLTRIADEFNENFNEESN